MLPTLRPMEYAVAVSEHLSFTRAAVVCFATQSTLSAGLLVEPICNDELWLVGPIGDPLLREHTPAFRFSRAHRRPRPLAIGSRRCFG